MIDLFTAKKGDRVEYQNYLCSESLRDERRYGIYQDFTFWSPDERPLEMWVDLIGLSEPGKGLRIRIRASQVTNILPAQEARV